MVEAELVEEAEALANEEPLNDAEDDPELVDVAELALNDAGDAAEMGELIELLREEVMVLFIEKVTELRNTPL
jgi:hypothetical protein